MEVQSHSQSQSQSRSKVSFLEWTNQELESMEDSSAFVKTWNLLVDATEVSRSLLARLLFAAHLAIVIAALQAFICIDSVWFFMLLWLLIALEYVIALIWEYPFTWLQPCVVVHLMVICPLIWCMEIGLHDPSWFTIKFESVPNCVNTTSIVSYLSEMIPRRQKALQFTVRSSEQILLLVLITVRWILPTRHVKHRSRVSQLLLMQIGRAADMSDIVDLFDVKLPGNNFLYDTIKNVDASRRAHTLPLDNKTLILMLFLWQVSLFQFAIDFTTRKKAKKSKHEAFSTFREVIDYCLETEIWSLLLSLVIQDLPFFCLRLYLMFGLRVFEEDIVFFMFNNAFIILLSLYRIYNILEERQKSVVEDALRDATDMFKVNAKQRLFQRFKFKSMRLKRHGTTSSDDSAFAAERASSLPSPAVAAASGVSPLPVVSVQVEQQQQTGKADATQTAIAALVVEPEIIVENCISDGEDIRETIRP